MKAIATKEDNIDSPLEDCFGKAKFFCFVDDNPGKIVFFPNPGYKLNKGSGKKAVLFLYKNEIKTVISKNYGVAVKKLLNKYEIQTVIIPPKYEKLSHLLKLLKPLN